MKAFAEVAFNRFERATKDLSEKEIDWKPLKEANSIRWILTHLSQEWNIWITGMLRRDPELEIIDIGKNNIADIVPSDYARTRTYYSPEGWPKHYVGNKALSMERIMKDLEKGKNTILNGLNRLRDEDFESEVLFFENKRKLEFVLMIFLTEIAHHEGQIAYLKGVI